MSFESIYFSTLNTVPAFSALLILVGAFSGLYFSMALGFYYITKFTNKIEVTEPIIIKPYFKRQILHEIKYSVSSIIIFALYGLLIIVLYRQNSLHISFNGGWQVLIDLAILIIWNEFHFYAGHRLMHTPLLIRYHRIHHKSVVVTPFSTYSFHPIESTIMGSVMIIPLLVYPFEIWSLIIFPIYHLFFNTVGHTNVSFIVKEPKTTVSTISSRHNAHHTKFSINYGFVSTLTDRLAKLFNAK